MEQQGCIHEHIVKQTALLQNILDVLVRIEEAVQALRGAEPQSNNGASSPNNRSK